MFWDNIPSGYYDKIVKSGLCKNRGLQSYWHHITFMKLKKYIKKDYKILDFACGPGTFFSYLDNKHSTGYDISSKQILYAKDNYGSAKNIFTSDLEDLKINNGYDLVTVNGLIEYLDENEFYNLLNNLKNLIKNKGEILITTPNYKIPMIIIEKLSHLFNLNDYSEVQKSLYTKKKFIKILQNQKQSFEVIEIKHFLNIFSFISFFNIKLAYKFDYMFEKITKNNFGFLLLVRIRVNNLNEN